MIQILVDPPLENPLNIREVENHPQFVKRIRLKSYKKSPIMTVQVTALALVLEQPMTITKINLACYAVHTFPFGVSASLICACMTFMVPKPRENS